jgi:site-specific DNA-methyltransferase (adenine-specific)
MNVHFSSKTDKWSTPIDFFNTLDEEFNFTLDPCCLPSSAKCDNYYTEEDDGLIQPWHGRVFMNPPYGRVIKHWIKKARDEVACGNAELVVCLVPSRTDTRWFHDYIYNKAEIRFIKGRLKFGGAKNSAPFPSMVVIFK